MTQFKIVTKLKQVDQIIEWCKLTGYMSHDFETCKGNYSSPISYPTILGISFQIGSAYIIPLGHKDSPFKDIYPEILYKIGKELIENSKVVKVAHNLKHEAHWWKRFGIELRGICHDSMLAKHALDEERPHGLKPLVEKFIPEYAHYELPGSKSKNFDWENVPIDDLSKYCAIDTDLCFRLMMWFEPKIIKNGLYRLYRNLMLMQVRVLMDAEHHGLLVDREYLLNLQVDYVRRITEKEKELNGLRIIQRYNRKSIKERKLKLIESIQDEIEEIKATDNNKRKIATRETKISNITNGVNLTKKEAAIFSPINFESPKQLIDFLFSSRYGLKLPIYKYTVDKKTKKKTGTPSTDEEVLTELEKDDKSGFIKCMLDLRKLNKFYSTYVLGMVEKIGLDDYVHGSFLIHGTVTGRLSSVEPNLQNIPRGTTSKDIKLMFIAPKDHILLEIDYSQAELRFAAEMFVDRKMIQYFKEGHDVHIATAADISKISYKEFEKMESDENHPKHIWAKKSRKKAKTYNFGILYGQTPPKLAESVRVNSGEIISIEQAKEFEEEWFNNFKGIKAGIKSQHKFATNKGYVRNMFGRKRRLPDALIGRGLSRWQLNSLPKNESGKYFKALRDSVNAPIQGSASDVTQLSAIMIWFKNIKGELPYKIKPMVYTVHDSQGYYLKPDMLPEIVPVLIDICSNPDTERYFGFKFKYVNMKVEAEAGKNWGSLKEFKNDENYIKWLKESIQ